MLKNNYISVMMFQLKLKVKCNNFQDYLVVNNDYKEQMKHCINLIQELKPDITIFPEMSYQAEFDSIFKELSKLDKIIVFGSTYLENINYTMVYSNGSLNKIQKAFPCGSEPMVRFISKTNLEEFLKRDLPSHEFYLKGNKIYILNCLEYYEAAYTIARTSTLNNDLFGFIVSCSNSNPNVFMEESKALHNHNEFIYSFVCNRIKEEDYSKYGKSYVYGPIQQHEKEWLTEEGIESDSHNSSILTINTNIPTYIYGEFAIGKSLSRFGRSDNYLNTSKNITVKNLF